MIEWIMVVFINGTTDYDIWGGYINLPNCQKTMAFLERRHIEKKQPFKAECWPVTSTIKYPRNFNYSTEVE